MDICEKIYTIFGRSIKSKLNRRRGFAIVEIIVVVVIISAFFTVLVKTLDSARGRAESGPGQARVMEDAVIFKGEVTQLINNGIADPIKIKEIMEARGGKDQYGNSYEFEIAGSILTIKPGNGLHEEVVTLDVTAKTAAEKSGV